MAQNPIRKQAVATASEPDSNTLDSDITLGDLLFNCDIAEKKRLQSCRKVFFFICNTP
jgi:hypothetical protein